MNKQTIAITLFTVLLSSSGAHAQSLAEKKEQKTANDALEKTVAELNEKCGTKIKGSIDFASWKDAEGISLSHCDFGLDQIRYMCDDADAKAAVKEKITSYVCKFNAKGERSVKLSNGTVTYTADKGIVMDNFVKEYLMKTL